ncbi:hypothetical protein Pelo_5878 [Pelomyxa schiedti]|nr:hypothetical protein Pelo_5878 [Pelomyxa schiedti]
MVASSVCRLLCVLLCGLVAVDSWLVESYVKPPSAAPEGGRMGRYISQFAHLSSNNTLRFVTSTGGLLHGYDAPEQGVFFTRIFTLDVSAIYPNATVIMSTISVSRVFASIPTPSGYANTADNSLFLYTLKKNSATGVLLPTPDVINSTVIGSFGASMAALEDDESGDALVVVGSPTSHVSPYTATSGAVTLYTAINDTLALHSLLLPTKQTTTSSLFGHSVSVSGDVKGTTYVAVGEPAAGSGGCISLYSVFANRTNSATLLSRKCGSDFTINGKSITNMGSAIQLCDGIKYLVALADTPQCVITFSLSNNGATWTHEGTLCTDDTEGYNGFNVDYPNKLVASSNSTQSIVAYGWEDSQWKSPKTVTVDNQPGFGASVLVKDFVLLVGAPDADEEKGKIAVISLTAPSEIVSIIVVCVGLGVAILIPTIVISVWALAQKRKAGYKPVNE